MEKKETQEPGVCSKNKKGGVYQIVNKLNGKIYVGSSNNMEKRWSKHKRLLMTGKHENTHLKNYMNKLSEKMDISENTLDEIFHFGCIEYEDDLVKRFAIEQEYLAILFDKGKMCYNQQKIANPQYNYTPSDPESTRKKMSIASKTRCNDEEYKKRLSIRTKAMWSNDDFRKKMCISISEGIRKPSTIVKKSDSYKKKWADPVFRAKQIAIYNSPECRKKNSNAIKKLWKNEEYKKKQSKSLKIAANRPDVKRKSIESKIRSGIIRPFFLINNGTVFYVESYFQWSRKHSLKADNIKKVRDGQKEEYKGYRLFLSPQSVLKENQKFLNTSKSADLRVIKPNRHLYVLSNRTYRENMMKKIKILRRK